VLGAGVGLGWTTATCRGADAFDGLAVDGAGPWPSAGSAARGAFAGGARGATRGRAGARSPGGRWTTGLGARAGVGSARSGARASGGDGPGGLALTADVGGPGAATGGGAASRTRSGRPEAQKKLETTTALRANPPATAQAHGGRRPDSAPACAVASVGTRDTWRSRSAFLRASRM
jgi:hypothetical protein